MQNSTQLENLKAEKDAAVARAEAAESRLQRVIRRFCEDPLLLAAKSDDNDWCVYVKVDLCRTFGDYRLHIRYTDGAQGNNSIEWSCSEKEPVWTPAKSVAEAKEAALAAWQIAQAGKEKPAVWRDSFLDDFAD